MQNEEKTTRTTADRDLIGYEVEKHDEDAQKQRFIAMARRMSEMATSKAKEAEAK